MVRHESPATPGQITTACRESQGRVNFHRGRGVVPRNCAVPGRGVSASKFAPAATPCRCWQVLASSCASPFGSNNQPQVYMKNGKKGEKSTRSFIIIYNRTQQKSRSFLLPIGSAARRPKCAAHERGDRAFTLYLPAFYGVMTVHRRRGSHPGTDRNRHVARGG